MDQPEFSCIVQRMQHGTTSLENYLAVSSGVRNTHIIWSSNSNPDIYSRETKTYIHKCPVSNVYNSCIHNSPYYKQPKCPSTSKMINKLQYIYTMECCPEFTKSTLLINRAQVISQDITLSKGSQKRECT
jgi:hypothetical protein